jgi:hypothetical protein
VPRAKKANDRIGDLLAENERLRNALMAIVESPRKAGILACQRIASEALRGGVTEIATKESSLGDPVYFARVIRYLHERCNSKCVYCDSTEELQIDHLLPVSRGGGDEVGNLVLACKACNQRKGTQTATEFGFRELALLTAASRLPTHADRRKREQAEIVPEHIREAILAQRKEGG